MLEVEGKTVSGPGDINCFVYLFIFVIFDWNSLHARLNRKNLKLKDVC